MEHPELFPALRALLDVPAGWTERAYCVLWDWQVIWETVVGDAAQIIAYTGLSMHFWFRRDSLPLVVATNGYLMSCASTHFFNSLMVIVPAYNWASRVGLTSGVLGLGAWMFCSLFDVRISMGPNPAWRRWRWLNKAARKWRPSLLSS